jgi:hypothetical protein
MAVGAGIRHHWRGAKGAFGRMQIRIKFHLCRAIGALGDPGFFHGLLWQLVCKCGMKIKLARGTAIPGAITGDSCRRTAVIAGQLPTVWRKTEIGPALIAGKAMFFTKI